MAGVIRGAAALVVLLAAAGCERMNARPAAGPDTRSEARSEAQPDPCATSDLEHSNLFFPPFGMTLASDAVDLLRQDTPGDELGSFATEAFRDHRPRPRLRILELARIFPFGDQKAQNTFFDKEWGFVIECDRIRGLTRVEVAETQPGKRSPISVGVSSCAMCHTGRVAGKVWEGLGNKRIDIFTVMADSHELQSWLVAARRMDFRQGPMARAIDKNSLRFSKRMSDMGQSNRTVGLVADAHVLWWVWEVTGGGQPPGGPRGEVKVPPLWNMKQRRGKCVGEVCEGGLFADGFGAGSGWFGGAVLGAGQAREVVAGKPYQDAIAKVEQVVFALQPPPRYPCPVDPALVAKGKELFEAKRCAKCHETRPGEAPHTVALDKIGTDEVRATGIGSSPQADQAFAAESRRRIDLLSAEIPSLARTRYADLDPDGTVTYGYVAPRLEGVWARFPYFHNGSVPTLFHVLSPPEERPDVFDVTRIDTRECFNPTNVGLRLDSEHCRPNLAKWSAPTNPEFFETTPALRNIYDTRRSGHDNKGHEFWRNAQTGAWELSVDDRYALIEYLKTIGETKEDPDWCPPLPHPPRENG